MRGDTLDRRVESRRAERDEVVRSGIARRKTLPRTSAQSPRQLERVTLLLFLLTICLSLIPRSFCSLPLVHASFCLSSFPRSAERSIPVPLLHVQFISSCPPSPSHLSTDVTLSASVSSSSFPLCSTSNDPLLFSTFPTPRPLSFASSSHSVFHFFPAASGANRATAPRAPRLPSPSTT